MRDAWIDVLVVGAGPAGSSVAARLARAGLRVVAVDRSAFPRDKPCSEYLSPEAVRLLDQLGVVADLERAGAQPLAGTVVRGPDGARLHGLFAEARPRPFRATGLSVQRRVLDARLVQAASEAGAEILERTLVEDLLDEDGVVAGARLRGPEGRRVVRARLTIGADGLRSRVATRLGLRRRGWLKRVAFVAHVEGVRGLYRSAEMHVGRRGYVGINAVAEGVANVALVVPAALAKEARGRAADFLFGSLEGFPGVRGRVDRTRLVGPVLATGPFATWSRRSVGAGVALVGDAAEFFDPFTGEGIYAALQGSLLLAERVPEALERPGLVTAERLRTYAVARRRAFAGKWAVERLIGYGMQWPRLFDRAVERLGRRGGMAHTLVGVTGDFVPARAVLNLGFLARMVL